MKSDTCQSIMSTLVILAGLTAVVFLAIHGDIHDGETVTAIVAALGLHVGLNVRKKNGDPPESAP